jgi:hypothetical protein
MAKPAALVARAMPRGGRRDEIPAADSDESKTARRVRIEAVFRAADASGLRSGKDGRIAGRVSADLIRTAKARTGLTSDTELVEFALANLALEDRFAETFRETQATVEPTLKLGF